MGSLWDKTSPCEEDDFREKTMPQIRVQSSYTAAGIRPHSFSTFCIPMSFHFLSASLWNYLPMTWMAQATFEVLLNRRESMFPILTVRNNGIIWCWFEAQLIHLAHSSTHLSTFSLLQHRMHLSCLAVSKSHCFHYFTYQTPAPHSYRKSFCFSQERKTCLQYWGVIRNFITKV